MRRELKFILAGILLLAAVLRIPLTSVGPLLPALSHTTGLTLTTLSQLTSISLLVFAVLSTLVPKITQKFGLIPTILGSIILMLAGIMIRSFTGNAGLFIGTIIIAIGICFGNVLLPTLAKTFFPNQVGRITSSYTIIMNLMGAVGSSIAIPVLTLFNNIPSLALASVALVVLPGFMLWLVIAIQAQKLDQGSQADVNHTVEDKVNVFKSKIAWSIAMFMGIQSLIFYTYVAWLPKIIESKGYSLAFGGSLLGMMQLMILPASFIVPIWAEKMEKQTSFVIFSGLSFVLGSVMLFSDNQVMMVVAVLILGMAIGSAFSLSLILFNLRTKSGQVSAKLSGMSQTIGYTLAAVGPSLFGILVNSVDSYTTPIIFLIIMGVLMIGLGYLAGKNATID